jgi:hypothetical protein
MVRNLFNVLLRHEQWRAGSSRHDEDPSLLVHFDFEQTDTSDWRLHNVSSRKNAAPDATIVGCQWVEGRWPDKHALEFRSVSDCVRLSVPGEFESLTPNRIGERCHDGSRGHSAHGNAVEDWMRRGATLETRFVVQSSLSDSAFFCRTKPWAEAHGYHRLVARRPHFDRVSHVSKFKLTTP